MVGASGTDRVLGQNPLGEDAQQDGKVAGSGPFPGRAGGSRGEELRFRDASVQAHDLPYPAVLVLVGLQSMKPPGF